MSTELFVTLAVIAVFASRIIGRLATYFVIGLFVFFILSGGVLPAFASPYLS